MHRVLEAGSQRQRFGQLKMDFRDIRRATRRLAIIRDRRVDMMRPMVPKRAPVMRFGEIGCQLDGAGEALLRVVTAVPRQRDIAAHEPIGRDLRPQQQCVLHRLCRLAEAPILITNQRQIIPGVGRIRIGGEDLAVDLLGLGERARLQQPQRVVEPLFDFFTRHALNLADLSPNAPANGAD